LALSAAKPNVVHGHRSPFRRIVGLLPDKSGISPTYNSAITALLQAGAERSEAQRGLWLSLAIDPTIVGLLPNMSGFSRNKSGISPTCNSAIAALLQVGAERSEAQRGSRLSLAINSNSLASPGQVGRSQPAVQRHQIVLRDPQSRVITPQAMRAPEFPEGWLL
jgi:hypothetical protein